jgi:hypothetical protein
MLENLRQLSYPKSFRIDDRGWPDLSELFASLSSLLNSKDNQPVTDDDKQLDLLKLVGEIGTIIWRLQKRSAAEIDPPEKIRRVSRDIESASDILCQGDIEIRDHTGQIYDGGMGLRVIAYQPMPGLSRAKIIETIRPTIYYRNKIVRIGEVIVGTPEKDTMPNASSL